MASYFVAGALYGLWTATSRSDVEKAFHQAFGGSGAVEIVLDRNRISANDLKAYIATVVRDMDRPASKWINNALHETETSNTTYTMPNGRRENIQSFGVDLQHSVVVEKRGARGLQQRALRVNVTAHVEVKDIRGKFAPRRSAFPAYAPSNHGAPHPADAPPLSPTAPGFMIPDIDPQTSGACRITHLVMEVIAL